MTTNKLIAPLCLFVLLTCVAPAMAQSQVDGALRLRTRAVLIEAVVKDQRTGSPVRELALDNFEVLDNGTPRKLTYFSREANAMKRPLTLVLVLDLRPSGAGRFFRQPEISKSLASALSKLPPEDEVAVIATCIGGNCFSRKNLTGFTHDRAKIPAALDSVHNLVAPYATLPIESLEGIIPEVVSLATSERPNSDVALVYISDGANSMMNTDRDRHTANLLRANVTFSALVCNKTKWVAAGGVTLTPLFRLIGASLNVLSHFAKQTGGEIVRVHKPEDYAKGLERIINDITARYTLGFDLDENEPDDGKVHRLEVRVKVPERKGKRQKVEVLARRGYYLPKSRQEVKDKASQRDAPAGAAAQADRAKQEQAIRQVIHDLSYAEMSGDMETFKRLTARRTLDLLRLWFDMLFKKLPRGEGAPSASNGDELLSMVLNMISGTRAKGMTPEQIEESARSKAKSRITFTDDRTAKVESADGVTSLAVFEDGHWKIDGTENLKKEILGMKELTAEEKERVRKY